MFCDMLKKIAVNKTLKTQTSLIGNHSVTLLVFLLSFFSKSGVTRKDVALSAISMNSALADKEFVLSIHHKLHVHVLK